MNSKEKVFNTLEFNNKSSDVPKELWTLPWAEKHYSKQLNNIQKNYPDDIIRVGGLFTPKSKVQSGDPYVIGKSVDAFGCVFTNAQEGIIGEVKDPIVNSDEWEDYENVHIPYEWLDINIDQVNKYCKINNDKFRLMDIVPRPFEQLQFIRRTDNFYCDIMFMPDNLKVFINKLHNFYCDLFEKWAKTDVDGLMFMDDWGSQRSLLINPTLWKELFKPLYKDYIDIAHKYNKKVFMHSDGYILDIIPELVDLGLDALNSQIFCIGLDNLAKYKGKITFWGEMDRQHLLVESTREEISKAVKNVYNTLWDNGGCIAQCEFGPGAKPELVEEVFKTWKSLKK